MKTKFSSASLVLVASFALVQLSGCDRRPVTADQPGSSSVAPKSGGDAGTAGGSSGSGMGGAATPSTGGVAGPGSSSAK